MRFNSRRWTSHEATVLFQQSSINRTAAATATRRRCSARTTSNTATCMSNRLQRFREVTKYDLIIAVR